MKFASYLDTPLGILKIVSDGNGLQEISLSSGEREPLSEDALTKKAAGELSEYFAGLRRVFDLSLSPCGTEFERLVWNELLKIPFGESRSYGQIAADIGKPGASRQEIIAAARAAKVDYFIRTMPQGYDTKLDNEASTLSAGQKQLLTIARIFLRNPPVLILDEATSSVDTRTEVEIGKAMKKLMSGRTSFVIAHRLSTIRDADMILFMEHGNIIEQGSHKELLKKNGAYAALYYSQFE